MTSSRAFRIRTAVWAVAVGIFMLVSGLEFGGSPQAQGSPSIWDGVYTEAQATRGKVVYTDQCAPCHGDTPIGTGMAPGLTGDDFIASFNNSTVGELFDRIQKTMPANDPGKMKPAEVADVIAFLATSNKWPAGEKELPADLELLKLIKIVKK